MASLLCNDCDSKFKSKSDSKCHTEGHDTLDSGKTFPFQQCNYIGKTPKRLTDHKQVYKEHRWHYAGCNAVFNHHQKLLNYNKGGSLLKFIVIIDMSLALSFVTE